MLGLLVLTSITILAVDLPGTGALRPVRDFASSAFAPVRSLGDAVFEPISNGWKGAFGYDDLKAENDELRDELSRMVGQEADVERLEAENEALKELNDISVAPLRTATARVISAPIANFDRTLEIDRGSGDGVKVGMAVVTSGNSVLGRIASVSAGTSQVQLVTEPAFEIGVRVGDGTRGVASGQGSGAPLIVESIDTADVEEGDVVFTSGVELSAFPPDLKVGRVSSVQPLASGAVSLEVEPLADLESSFVKVVLKDPPR